MAPKSPNSLNSLPHQECGWLLENQGLEPTFKFAAQSRVGCLTMHRQQGSVGLTGRVWTSLSFRPAAFSQSSFEVGVTLENLGRAPLLIEELHIAQLFSESVPSQRPDAHQLRPSLQAIGRLVALPGEIVVLSSLRLQSRFSGQLSELVEFKLNSDGKQDCIVRYAIDSSDICVRTAREPWTAFSQLSQ